MVSRVVSAALFDPVIFGATGDHAGDPQTVTESFVAMKVNIGNWRWAGTPFYLRRGKEAPMLLHRGGRRWCETEANR